MLTPGGEIPNPLPEAQRELYWEDGGALVRWLALLSNHCPWDTSLTLLGEDIRWPGSMRPKLTVGERRCFWRYRVIATHSSPLRHGVEPAMGTTETRKGWLPCWRSAQREGPAVWGSR